MTAASECALSPCGDLLIGEAIEVVYEANYTITEVFITRRDNAISVMFRSLKEDFPSYQPAFREAIESVRIR